MKQIGIYNPYLETRGGGEKVCLALAAALAKQQATVTLIVHHKINLKELGTYLDVDTKNLRTEIIRLSTMAKIVHRLPLVPSGLKNLFSDWTTFRKLRRKNYDIFINNCIDSNLPNPSKIGVYACMFPHRIGGKPAKSLAKEVYRHILRGLYRLLLHPGKKHAVYTYNLITANSAYTQGYIHKYWGQDSNILYPICDNMKEEGPAKKDKIILNVGRFFANSDVNHHKRHDFLVENFAKMKQLHKEGWELHFVGSVAEDTGALKYILRLIKLAQGSPVYFHFNAPHAEVKKLYNQASIYWHATGYGSDPKKYPGKQEHFGISTVEAMSAGCIPIVINSAGQRESVIPGTNGFLWHTPKELQEHTIHVAKLESHTDKQLRTEAIKTATRFNKTAFDKQVQTIFGDMLA